MKTQSRVLAHAPGPSVPPTEFTDHHCQFYSQHLLHMTVLPCANLEQNVSTVLLRRAGCPGSTKQGSFEAGVLNVANFEFFGMDREFIATHTPVSLKSKNLSVTRIATLALALRVVQDVRGEVSHEPGIINAVAASI